VNVATLQPPAGAGNVVTVFVPGLADIFDGPGALTITIPEPPDAPPRVVGLELHLDEPPPPPPVLTVPATPGVPAGPAPVPAPPPPGPPAPPLKGVFAPQAHHPPPPPPPA
jgi:hypothetical protein